MNNLLIIIISLLLPSVCFAATATNRLSQAFNIKIKQSKSLDEYTLREAILKAIPRGSSREMVLSRLDDLGIDTPRCAPVDASPMHCGATSSPGTKMENDPNFYFDFIFDNDKVSDVVVTRWYRDVKKTFITTYKKPDKSIKLRAGLGVGSTIAELEKAYGRWKVDTVGDEKEGWPLTVNFYSKYDQLDLVVGIDIGDISRNEFQELRNDHSRLRDMPAGIILFVK